jgi:hypothetical protein
MPLTNFPFGVSSFGVPVFGGGNGLIPITSGQYFWVDSNATGPGTQGSFKNPFTTLAAAYVACVASRGDVIIMKPGHAETIATNTALALSKIGVSVIGLGSGSLRPLITLTGTTAAVSIAVSAASQTFRNFVITSGVIELAKAFTISAADVTIDGVDYRETVAANTILSFVTLTNAADRFTLKNCTLKSITTSAGNASCFASVAGADDTAIVGNHIEWIGADNAVTCAIYNAGAGLRMLIANNVFKITGGTSVTVINATTCTGMAIYNSAGTAGTTITSNYQFDGGYSIQCFVTDTVNSNGMLDPAAISS